MGRQRFVMVKGWETKCINEGRFHADKGYCSTNGGDYCIHEKTFWLEVNGTEYEIIVTKSSREWFPLDEEERVFEDIVDALEETFGREIAEAIAEKIVVLAGPEIEKIEVE